LRLYVDTKTILLRRPQKTTMLFILIFLVGLIGFITYINSTFETEETSPIAIPETEQTADAKG